MKMNKFLVLIVVLVLIFSCHNFERSNEYDPESDNYQGWPIVKDPDNPEVEFDLYDVFGYFQLPYLRTADTTPLFDWPDLRNAVKYDFKWALSLEALPSAVVHTVTNSEYQFTTVLSHGDDVYFQLKVYDSAGNSSGWSLNPVVDQGGIAYYCIYIRN